MPNFGENPPDFTASGYGWDPIDNNTIRSVCVELKVSNEKVFKQGDLRGSRCWSVARYENLSAKIVSRNRMTCEQLPTPGCGSPKIFQEYYILNSNNNNDKRQVPGLGEWADEICRNLNPPASCDDCGMFGNPPFFGFTTKTFTYTYFCYKDEAEANQAIAAFNSINQRTVGLDANGNSLFGPSNCELRNMLGQITKCICKIHNDPSLSIVEKEVKLLLLLDQIDSCARTALLTPTNTAGDVVGADPQEIAFMRCLIANFKGDC